MRYPLIVTLGVCVIVLSAMAWTGVARAQPSKAEPSSMEEVLRSIRADMQNSRTDTMAKNVKLTTAQAAAFWPKFEAYQKEQGVIMDDQLKSIQWYIENFETADDAAALNLMKAHLARDTKMTALRERWLGEFQKVLGTKLAVRVMQIDRRLSLSHQAYVASRIPLAQ
jgi:Spy/CpxP family protein refolding chaperone